MTAQEVEVLNNIILGLGTNYFAGFTIPKIQEWFGALFKKRPELQSQLAAARTPEDFEQFFKKAAGVIDALAADGSITIDKAFLEAIHGIRFDHQNGTVTILGSTLSAPRVQTGGSGEGFTFIGDKTTLKSAGTKIDIGDGASIQLGRGAKIFQN